VALLPEYERLDGVALADLVRRREVSPEALLDAALERLDARNPAVNAVVLRLEREARAAIAAGLPRGPFTGVPYLVKDLAPCAGTVTTYGLGLLRGAVAERDSEVVARSRRAGLVVFGKTNTPELGLTTTTEPRLHGPTRNPWDLGRSAGGSSGGAAAAVAAGIVPMAHASDGGGSIRIPASACGLFGLKVTRARTPSGPDFGEGWSGAANDHAITRSVRDSAALLDAIAGPDVGDPYWAPPPARPFLAEVGADPGRLRVTFTTVPWNGQPVDPACVEAVAAAARLCETLGHEVVEDRPEWDEKARGHATRVVIGAHARAALDRVGRAIGREVTAEDVEVQTWANAEYGRARTAADYAHALTVLHRTGRAVARFFGRRDVLLTPTMCRPPYELGVLSLSNPDTAAFHQAIASTTAFTSPFNATGNPAMSVPLHWTAGGLPVGVQFVGAFGAEATLLRLAAQLEAARPWADRRPPPLSVGPSKREAAR
jgi:Asp-tRNA(Asn)/Glu-tRNA(Gln) amidotransferase A subunit family amidase